MAKHLQETLLGVANGIATLDAAGLIPSSQLPSYVDDVLEYANLAAFPATGEAGKIYIALDSGTTYRWSGTIYVRITDGTASWGSIEGTLSAQTDLQNALDAKVNVAGDQTISGVKTFSSAPVVPDASFSIAKVSGLQTALDALNTLATNLGNDKVAKAGDTMTGDLEFTDAAKGVILKSANGTRYRVTVDNDGSLTTSVVA